MLADVLLGEADDEDGHERSAEEGLGGREETVRLLRLVVAVAEGRERDNAAVEALAVGGGINDEIRNTNDESIPRSE